MVEFLGKHIVAKLGELQSRPSTDVFFCRCRRSIKRSVVNREPIKEQLEDLEDHRPFFTYWVTTVQILILALSIFTYGLGPVGFDLTQRSGLVSVTYILFALNSTNDQKAQYHYDPTKAVYSK